LPDDAAFAGKRTVTPRSRDGMIESLRVLVGCRKTAVTARRIALQMIQNTIVSAPDALRNQLRIMTRMKLVRTLAAWRPDLTGYREVEAAYRISLKSLARRHLELHDEIADLDTMIAAIVDDLAPNRLRSTTHRRHHALSEVIRIRSGHRCWPPAQPASGIRSAHLGESPFRLGLITSCSSAGHARAVTAARGLIRRPQPDCLSIPCLPRLGRCCS
jgi:hypothetical protein